MGGFGGGARGKGLGTVGHALFCFLGDLGPPASVARSPTHRLVAATPSMSISPAWPYSYRDACTLPHLLRGFAQLRWAVVASLAWGFGRVWRMPSVAPPPLFCERLFALVFVRPDPRPVPFPNPYRISPDPSDWLAWIHSASCGLLQGRAWAWALVRWVVGLFLQSRNGLVQAV